MDFFFIDIRANSTLLKVGGGTMNVNEIPEISY